MLVSHLPTGPLVPPNPQTRSQPCVYCRLLDSDFQPWAEPRSFLQCSIPLPQVPMGLLSILWPCP